MRYVSTEAVDNILARTSSGGTTAWYLTDRLGSVRDIVNASGAVIDHIVYDSYGNILSETSPSNGDRFKFTGMEWDAAIGQYYDHARWYGAGVGRFHGQDPSGFAAVDSDLYRYAWNSPPNFIDLSGESGDPPPPEPVNNPGPEIPGDQYKQLIALQKAEAAAIASAYARMKNSGDERAVYLRAAQLAVEAMALQLNYLNDQDSKNYNAYISRQNGKYNVWVKQMFLQRKVEDQMQTILHEAAHMVKRELKVKYTQMEEAQADQFAAFVLAQIKSEEAYKTYMNQQPKH